MEQKSRPKELGMLLVVGGPGGSGSSTIAKMLAEYFSLERIYGGEIFRNVLKEMGYANNEDAYYRSNEQMLLEIDKKVDNILIDSSRKPNVLIESKIFSAIATKSDIPTTARIWITANLHTRALRTLDKNDLKFSLKNIFVYLKNIYNLRKRYALDRVRYKELYGIKYDNPKEYNDIVIDSSHMDERETFDLILKYLNDGGYIK